MFQVHFPGIRPLTTAHLAQTMTLLSLAVNELKQQIDSELAANPALEMVDERRCPSCHRLLPDYGVCPVCSCPQNSLENEPIVFLSPQDDFSLKGEYSQEDLPENDYSPVQETLPTYVLRQIAPDLDIKDRKVAAYFLTNLDEDGLLTIPLIEIARYCHVTIQKVQEIQRMIQHADPVGVGSLTTSEALLVQLEVLSEITRVPKLAKEIIQHAMDLLSRRQYTEIARKFKVSSKQVEQTVHFISENLNPFPARSHWGESRQSDSAGLSVYRQPDIVVNYLNSDPTGPLIVEIVMPIRGTLRVNPLFRQAIQQSSPEKKEDWKSDLERASLFVKCLQQRNHTIQRLIQRVVSLQRDFIINGEKHLKPITRAYFSKELGVHESTISRAVANKTVQLPNKRIIPLSSFFDRSLNVRTVLKNIIEDERIPLSDAELAELLSKEGFSVARRTVAKYRAMEGILPAHLRQPIPQRT
jgi:RNA polymerase sigma-54 factor